MARLNELMIMANTAPELRKVIKEALTSSKEGGSAYYIPTSKNDRVKEAFKEQEQLGWKALLEGCIQQNGGRSKISISNG